ncbi:relaxosome protein TraM [Salmonella enterica]|nr:relaxosome protein TraM [Salmonella enterica]
MPRQNVYLKQKTLDEIRNIVDERIAEGASSADANMSSVCSELLEVGLRVTLQIKKREEEEERNGGLTDEEMFRQRLLEECMKSRMASQYILSYMFDLNEIKEDSRKNYSELISKFRDEIKETMQAVFPEREK